MLRPVTLLLLMIAAVFAANILVNYPVNFTLTIPFSPGDISSGLAVINLADILTYGAFIYPVTFLVTDITNRRFGPVTARRVVLAGFVVGVCLSYWLGEARIAIASGTAFFFAQFMDITIFHRLRHGRWWLAPVISSFCGSLADTALFFSLAFAAAASPIFGGHNDFAVAAAPLLGLYDAIIIPRWISWAMGDLTVKLLVALLMLLPYRLSLIGANRPAEI